MKKFILILGFCAISWNTEAYEGTISQSGSCGATDADCHYDLYNDGHLEISGTGEMTDWDYSLGNPAPWARATYQEANDSPVTSVNINGITKVGRWAFLWCRELEDVKISDSVKEIGFGAFEQTGSIGTLVIPESVELINNFVFSQYGNGTIVIEGNPKLYDASFVNTQVATIYCQKNLDCLNKGVLNGVDYSGGIVSYTKEGGVYILEDGNMYASASDMAESKNACDDISSCKAKVLKNKGLCKGDVCSALVAASNAGQMLKIGSKTYQSLDDLLKGNYDKRRIYTLEEANFVAGDKNRISIKYR